RASLISRARHRIDERNTRQTNYPKPNNRWHRILDACSAWWRPWVTQGGEEVVLLAMRWELTHQIKVDLPGVTDQKSLVRLGKMFGVIDQAPGVPGHAEGGDERLAVLSRGLTDQLLQGAGELTDPPNTDDDGQPSA